MLRQYHDGSRQSAHPAKSREQRTMSEPSDARRNQRHLAFR